MLKPKSATKARQVRPARIAENPTKSDITRQRIIDSAAKVFAENGYARARLSDIAAEANTQAGGIYYYFDSREALVEEVLRLSSTRITDYVRETLATMSPEVSYRERILKAIEIHCERLLAGDIYTSAYRKIHDQIPPEIQERYVKYPRAYGRFWDDLIKGAQRAGEMRRDIDTTMLRLQLLGSISWALEWYRPGRLTPLEIAREFSTIFFEGVCPKTPAVGRSKTRRQK